MRSVYLLMLGMTGCGGAARAAEETVTVAMAVRDLPPGIVITVADLTTRTLPRSAVPASVAAMDDALARGVCEPILAGELVRRERLCNEGAGYGLGAVIPPSQRAVQVPVSAAEGWSPLIHPQDTVDIYWTEGLRVERTDGDSGAPAAAAAHPTFTTRGVIQAARVLAVNEGFVPAEESKVRGYDSSDSWSYGRPAGNAGVLTLVLPADDALTLLEARATGGITIALRSDIDLEQRRSPALTLQELLAPVPLDGTGGPR